MTGRLRLTLADTLAAATGGLITLGLILAITEAHLRAGVKR